MIFLSLALILNPINLALPEASAATLVGFWGPSTEELKAISLATDTNSRLKGRIAETVQSVEVFGSPESDPASPINSLAAFTRLTLTGRRTPNEDESFQLSEPIPGAVAINGAIEYRENQYLDLSNSSMYEVRAASVSGWVKGEGIKLWGNAFDPEYFAALIPPPAREGPMPSKAVILRDTNCYSDHALTRPKKVELRRGSFVTVVQRSHIRESIGAGDYLAVPPDGDDIYRVECGNSPGYVSGRDLLLLQGYRLATFTSGASVIGNPSGINFSAETGNYTRGFQRWLTSKDTRKDPPILLDEYFSCLESSESPGGSWIFAAGDFYRAKSHSSRCMLRGTIGRVTWLDDELALIYWADNTPIRAFSPATCDDVAAISLVPANQESESEVEEPQDFESQSSPCFKCDCALERSEWPSIRVDHEAGLINFDGIAISSAIPISSFTNH